MLWFAFVFKVSGYFCKQLLLQNDSTSFTEPLAFANITMLICGGLIAPNPRTRTGTTINWNQNSISISRSPFSITKITSYWFRTKKGDLRSSWGMHPHSKCLQVISCMERKKLSFVNTSIKHNKLFWNSPIFYLYYLN